MNQEIKEAAAKLKDLVALELTEQAEKIDKVLEEIELAAMSRELDSSTIYRNLLKNISDKVSNFSVKLDNFEDVEKLYSALDNLF